MSSNMTDNHDFSAIFLIMVESFVDKLKQTIYLNFERFYVILGIMQTVEFDVTMNVCRWFT